MRRLLTSSLSALCFTAVAFSANAQTPALSKGDVETIVKEYLVANPEVVVEALEAYRDKQDKLAQEKTKQAIEKNRATLFNSPTVPSVGPADADVVIAQFFDYHCGYCKHMLPVVTQLLKEDKKIRVVFHELPILSDDSKTAAKAALAVYQMKPEQYFAFHTALMKAPGKFTKESLIAEAVKLGLDKAKFTAALDMPQLENALKTSSDMARELGVSGTPAFVVNDEFIPGASSLENLKELIAAQRQAKAAVKP